ncbi:SLC13 family permease [Arsenicitalea aurantiaca]|uniref:SLC13 family permease n=1 Tax=Arsenicitalea aurantiaca TaxID=1783274 RepID=A0A433XK28_9HYPH|nr:SLC13 family permease [Arsenicitalea aurantiaca]RUT34437.1 SLC13 family permease [Arsenicitalea aurantiaca]
MSYEQITLICIFAVLLGTLVWGRIRYDIVSFAALLAGVVLGVVPAREAFSGFGHEATIIVALVLVVSTGLSRSGAVELVTRRVIDSSHSITRHILEIGGIGAILSAFMNNVAALALLMPVDIQAAQKAGRAPSATLMALSSATILGGLITVIGTPANIIVASYRAEMTGTPFAMFDYAPVGLICAAAGIGFIALFGWRLIPQRSGSSAITELKAIEDFVTELVVGPKSAAIGQTVRDLLAPADDNDVSLIGLVRKGRRLPGRALAEEVGEGDLLVVQASTEALNRFAGAMGLDFQGKAGTAAPLSSDMSFAEAVVNRDSRLLGRSANDVQLLRAYGVSLLGISRNGRTIKQRVRRTPIQAGDVLLLLGNSESLGSVMARLDCLPLVTTATVTDHSKAMLSIGLFVGAVMLSVLGLLPLSIGLGIAVLAYVFFDIVPLRELYDAIEWPIIVLLGALIPLGGALETSGATALIAGGLAGLTVALPGWVALTVILVVTMMLSDILNNAATAVIAAPIAYGLATALEVNPDPFLMAVAIGASCAFLTPIGHQNNLLILGPGGYRFTDYFRFGLPLELIIVVVSVPAILVFWPL